MSQAQVTVEPQIVAAGLVPLLKEYTQRLQEISTNARKMQRRYARARLGTQRAAQARRTGLNAPAPTKEQQLAAQDTQADFDSLRFAFNRLLPSGNDLSRQASQLIEHGKLRARHPD